ncbi:MAG: MetQ/NlpA family ABC transporter substrate-binding protein [Eubacteriaceae bacterium]|nr:MetQ/NlpA family ABC transporter substrate-binding protein [Eubacteriaceae bacterium]
MKKAKHYGALPLALLLIAAFAAGCTNNNNSTTNTGGNNGSGEPVKLVVGATPVPHADILEVVKGVLAEEGIELEIVEFQDYVIPNTALDAGELDANFFQHQPYLDSFNEERGMDLVALVGVHFEPLGLYPGRTATLEELQDGAIIAVPNDTTNEARALMLLESAGLITLAEGAGMSTTINDIVENPRNISFNELDAAMINKVLPDVDFAVINGNFAIDAGLDVATDALVLEDKNSLAAATYANIVVTRNGDDRPEILALAKAITGDAVKKYLEDTYNGGAVVPVF